MKQLLELQDSFTRKVIEENFGVPLEELSKQQRQRLMNDLVLHIVDECFEFLRETNWKMHRKIDKPFDREAAVVELVDVSKFLMNFLVILDVSYDEFKALWLKKHDIVLQRWEEEHGGKETKDS